MILSLEEYKWPMKPPHRPYAHQKETAEFLIRNKRAYVLSDLGVGKTLSVLWATDVLFEFGKIRKVLIVCPLSTIRVVWGREIFTHFPHRQWAVAHGTRDQRVYAIRSDVNYVIINHDGLKVVESEIVAEKFDIVVFDELTAFKTVTADRSKCAQRVAKSVRSCWGITGAPTPNSPTEAFGQAKVVNPSNPFLPRYFSKFRDMVEVQVAPYVWVPKPDAKRIVHQVLQPSIRHDRDVCLDLPPVVHHVREVAMSAHQAKVYADIRDELIHSYKKGDVTASNAAVKLSKLLQVSAGTVYDDTGGVLTVDSSPKDDALLEVFDELGRTKMIVVSAFKSSVERLTAFFRSKKIRAEFIHGDIGMNKRAEIMDSFTDRDLQVLVIQPQTVSHGVNLTVSSTIVWQSYVASGETYNQMNGRITRAGQTKKQFVIHLINSKAEAHILRILQDKMRVSDEVLKMFETGDL